MVQFEISSPTSPEYVAVVVNENVILSDHNKQFLYIRHKHSPIRRLSNRIYYYIIILFLLLRLFGF